MEFKNKQSCKKRSEMRKLAELDRSCKKKLPSSYKVPTFPSSSSDGICQRKDFENHAKPDIRNPPMISQYCVCGSMGWLSAVSHVPWISCIWLKYVFSIMNWTPAIT